MGKFLSLGGHDSQLNYEFSSLTDALSTFLQKFGF